MYTTWSKCIECHDEYYAGRIVDNSYCWECIDHFCKSGQWNEEKKKIFDKAILISKAFKRTRRIDDE